MRKTKCLLGLLIAIFLNPAAFAAEDSTFRIVLLEDGVGADNLSADATEGEFPLFSIARGKRVGSLRYQSLCADLGNPPPCSLEFTTDESGLTGIKLTDLTDFTYVLGWGSSITFASTIWCNTIDAEPAPELEDPAALVLACSVEGETKQGTGAFKHVRGKLTRRFQVTLSFAAPAGAGQAIQKGFSLIELERRRPRD